MTLVELRAERSARYSAGCLKRDCAYDHRSRLLLSLPSHSACDVVVPARGKAIVKTDLAVATPLDCYARIGEHAMLSCRVCKG